MMSFISRKLTRKFLANSPSFSGTYFHSRTFSVQLESTQYGRSNPRNNHHFVTRNRILDGSAPSIFGRRSVVDLKLKALLGFFSSAKFDVVNPNNWASRIRHLSTSSSSTESGKLPESLESSGPYPGQNPELFRYRVVKGSKVVEREFSSIEDETRRVIEGLGKTMYSSSKAFAIFGLVQFGMVVWISPFMLSSPPALEVAWLSANSSLFPFWMAFMMWRAGNSLLDFKNNLEEIGRLQTLTLGLLMKMSISKIRGVIYFSVAVTSAGFLVIVFHRLSS